MSLLENYFPPLLGRRLRRHPCRHRHRSEPNRGTEPLRHPALQLLLRYLGLLVHGVPRLAIPNQTVKRLMYGFLHDGYKDQGLFRINLFRLEQLLMEMSNDGEWRPVLEFLSEAIARQTGIRDYIAGEKVMAPRAGALGFLAAYLS